MCVVRADRLRIVGRLLDAIRMHPTYARTRQFAFANINVDIGREIADCLEPKGFLRISHFGSRYNYQITTQGLLLLKQINWCYDALADKVEVGVMLVA